VLTANAVLSDLRRRVPGKAGHLRCRCQGSDYPRSQYLRVLDALLKGAWGGLDKSTRVCRRARQSPPWCFRLTIAMMWPGPIGGLRSWQGQVPPEERIGFWEPWQLSYCMFVSGNAAQEHGPGEAMKLRRTGIPAAALAAWLSRCQQDAVGFLGQECGIPWARPSTTRIP
jgi:hypothetical protein